jgi:NhaP-type Na+/H+ or K+/H+ antiporter
MLFGLIAFSFLPTNELKRNGRNFFFLFFSILLTQTIYRSVTTLLTIANTIQNSIFADMAATTARINIQSPDAGFLFCYYIFILELILIILLSLITSVALIIQLYKSNYKNRNIEFFMVSSLLSFVLLFMISFISLPAFIERPIAFIVLYLCLSLPFLLYQLEKTRKIYTNLIIAIVFILIIFTVLIAGWYSPYNVITTSEITGRNFLTKHPELEIEDGWSMKNVYIKRLTNFEVMRGEKIKGYLENVENKSSIYHNGDFIVYNVRSF